MFGGFWPRFATMAIAIPPDTSNGYEAHAQDFMAARSQSNVGVSTVRAWATALPNDASVLDLGCGHGVPISELLVELGANLYGIDASPTLIAAFLGRFPDVQAECNTVEDSHFFRRQFDAVVAWGLMFLLTARAQEAVIYKVSAALKPGATFLFTSPGQACQWPDNLTGRQAISLGTNIYRQILVAAGLSLVGESEDEGQNHYYFVQRGYRHKA